MLSASKSFPAKLHKVENQISLISSHTFELGLILSTSCRFPGNSCETKYVQAHAAAKIADSVLEPS